MDLTLGELVKLTLEEYVVDASTDNRVPWTNLYLEQRSGYRWECHDCDAHGSWRERLSLVVEEGIDSRHDCRAPVGSAHGQADAADRDPQPPAP